MKQTIMFLSLSACTGTLYRNISLPASILYALHVFLYVSTTYSAQPSKDKQHDQHKQNGESIQFIYSMWLLLEHAVRCLLLMFLVD
jgi:hypothetical protein